MKLANNQSSHGTWDELETEPHHTIFFLLLVAENCPCLTYHACQVSCERLLPTGLLICCLWETSKCSNLQLSLNLRLSCEVYILRKEQQLKVNLMSDLLAWHKKQNYLSRDMTIPTKRVCAKRSLRSAWASAQSDQSLRCPHEETLGP